MKRILAVLISTLFLTEPVFAVTCNGPDMPFFKDEILLIATPVILNDIPECSVVESDIKAALEKKIDLYRIIPKSIKHGLFLSAYIHPISLTVGEEHAGCAVSIGVQIEYVCSGGQRLIYSGLERMSVYSPRRNFNEVVISEVQTQASTVLSEAFK